LIVDLNARGLVVEAAELVVLIEHRALEDVGVGLAYLDLMRLPEGVVCRRRVEERLKEFFCFAHEVSSRTIFDRLRERV
jgi:urease gamma subunit